MDIRIKISGKEVSYEAEKKYKEIARQGDGLRFLAKEFSDSVFKMVVESNRVWKSREVGKEMDSTMREFKSTFKKMSEYVKEIDSAWKEAKKL